MSLGFGEIVVLLIVAVIVLGPKKLPEFARMVGRAARELRHGMDSLQEGLERAGTEAARETDAASPYQTADPEQPPETSDEKQASL